MPVVSLLALMVIVVRIVAYLVLALEMSFKTAIVNSFFLDVFETNEQS